MAEKKIKFLELADLLEKELVNLPPETPATTLNELINRFQVSRGTAKRTLLELQQRGILYSRVGAGSFVAPAQRKKLILIAFDLNRSLADTDMFNEQFLVRALICCNLRHPQYNVAAIDFNDLLRDHEHLEILHSRLKGVILLRSITPYLEVIGKLNQRDIPSAFYGSSTYLKSLSRLDYLVYNEETIMEMILQVLAERGCTNPGFVGDLSFPVYQERLKFFRKNAARYKMNYVPRLVLNTTETDLSDRKILRRYFCELDSVITTDDHQALRLSQMAVQLGFRIPDELAITGINNIPYLDLYSNPGITTVELNTGNDAERMIDLMIHRIENGEAFQTETDIRLIKRTSA